MKSQGWRGEKATMEGGGVRPGIRSLGAAGTELPGHGGLRHTHV